MAHAARRACAVLRPDQLPEDERHRVRRLPVGGVEEVREGVGGEGGQPLWAVEGEVDAARAPPLGAEGGDGVQESGGISTNCVEGSNLLQFIIV